MTQLELEQMSSILSGPPDPEMVMLEARLRRAQLDADVPTLDALIADALLFSGLVRRHEPEELQVRRVRADVAVTALRAGLTVDVGGAPVSGTFRYTRVWAREPDGRWRVVGGNVSLLPQVVG